MCGRVIQASPSDLLALKVVSAMDPSNSRVKGDPFGNVPPRYDAAPSRELRVIRRRPTRANTDGPAEVGSRALLVQRAPETMKRQFIKSKDIIHLQSEVRAARCR